MQNVLNGGSVEVGGGGGTALVDECESGCEGLNSPGDTIAAHSSQLDEIVGRGNGNKQASIIAQNAPEFARIHPSRNRQNNREGAIGIRHGAISIGHYPFALRIASGRGIDGRNRDVHPMRVESRLADKGAKVKTVAATGIENDITGRRGKNLRDRAQQRFRNAAIVQPAPPLDGSRRVSRLF